MGVILRRVSRHIPIEVKLALPNFAGDLSDVNYITWNTYCGSPPIAGNVSFERNSRSLQKVVINVSLRADVINEAYKDVICHIIGEK